VAQPMTRHLLIQDTPTPDVACAAVMQQLCIATCLAETATGTPELHAACIATGELPSSPALKRTNLLSKPARMNTPEAYNTTTRHSQRISCDNLHMVADHVQCLEHGNQQAQLQHIRQLKPPESAASPAVHRQPCSGDGSG
jgi:hypothetical protein